MKIFITYSRANKEPIEVLVKDLEELGHDVWFDEELNGGQSWWDNILSNIRDCEVYAYAITQEALDSTACKRELDYAKALNKSVLPVLIDRDISMAIVPRYLSNVQYVEYSAVSDKNEVFALLRAINSLAPSPGLPDPLPDQPTVPISYLDDLKDKIDAPNLDKRDQVALVSELKLKLADPDNKKEDIYKLLRKLRKHDDLFASVSVDIDELLAQETASTPRVKPPVVKPPDPVVNNPLKEPVPVKTAEKTAAETNPAATSAEAGWTSGLMTLLVILTILFFPVGLVAGLVGRNGGATKSQSTTLIVVSIVVLVLELIAVSEGF